MSRRRAFTYIELMIVAVVVAIITAAAVSDSDSAAKQEGESAGEVFAGDVAYARSLAIARPDDPVVIKVDADNNQYWLAHASAPDTPITHPQTGDPYLVSFGPSGNSGLEYVEILAHNFNGDTVLVFDPFGGIDQAAPAILQLTSGGAAYELSVAPITTRTTINKELSVDLSGEMLALNSKAKTKAK